MARQLHLEGDMPSSLEITFRGMSPSPSVEAVIRDWVARLENKDSRIQRCSVVVDQPHRHQTHGNRFHIGIEVGVPGRDIVISRDPELDPGHEDIYIAIADAFRAARRQLQDHSHIQRGDVKSHTTP